jgi:transcriptional regulator with XRE-family HTH domain
MSADLLREARKRAGLSQRQLAARVGRPQSAIARWESGRVRPSLETLRDLVRACDLELTVGLAAADDSYVAHIDRMLRLTPAERVARAVGTAATLRGLRRSVETARRG